MKNRLGLIFVICAMAVGCSSTPPVTEISETADPSQEIGRVEMALRDADTRQVGVLSPKNYASASDSLDTAKEYMSKNKSQKTILHEIALADAYLRKANENAEVSSKILGDAMKYRQAALQAGAPDYYPKEFTKLDNDLKDATKDVESNDTSSAESLRGNLAGRYSDIELQSIRKAKMGEARAVQEEADKEGARKLSPGTWAWADEKISADDAAVVANRHDDNILNSASADAKNAADRLLKMTRLAKNSASETPEETAGRLEKDQIAQQQDQQKINVTNSELNAKAGTAAVLSAENRKLEEQTDIDRKYEAARQEFSDDEAEVYKQGDKLLLRLKGLSFPTDQAVITTNNYPLLSKVQKVIKDVGPEAILIEGHTDSTGPKRVNSKLSAERAEAVEGYLVANDLVQKDKVTTKGFGDSRPIATNKTPTGRAQNRRVDVIITPKTVQE